MYAACLRQDTFQERLLQSEPTHMARAMDARTSSEHIALLVCALNFWLWYCVPPTRKQQPARRSQDPIVAMTVQFRISTWQ